MYFRLSPEPVTGGNTSAFAGYHLGSGANAAKFTVNVWENRDFDAR